LNLNCCHDLGDNFDHLLILTGIQFYSAFIALTLCLTISSSQLLGCGKKPQLLQYHDQGL
jgi:hypothetical protein